MSELDEQIAFRRRKRDRLRERGVEAFPARAAHDLEPADVQAHWGEWGAEQLAEAKIRLRVPGRIRAIREQGKLVFLDLHDGAAQGKAGMMRARRVAMARTAAHLSVRPHSPAISQCSASSSSVKTRC